MRRFGSIAAAIALSFGLLLSSRPACALEFGVSVSIAPPELPVYEQPELPGPGYIWTPGYWAWGDEGYYWVPGTWVLPPQEGYLWTPGYWVWDAGVYLWRPGYWSTQVGFYGGVNYGFGYFGRGYEGGYWDHGGFHYNRACNHIGNDIRITNVYNRSVNFVTVNHASYNGGRGGIQVHASERELAVERAHHFDAVAAQRRQVEVARSNPELRMSANHGQPGIAATPRAGEFSGRGIVAAHGAPPVSHAPPEQHNPAYNPAYNAGHGPGRELLPPQVSQPNGSHPQEPPRAPPPQLQARTPPPQTSVPPPQHTEPQHHEEPQHHDEQHDRQR